MKKTLLIILAFVFLTTLSAQSTTKISFSSEFVKYAVYSKTFSIEIIAGSDIVV